MSSVLKYVLCLFGGDGLVIGGSDEAMVAVQNDLLTVHLTDDRLPSVEEYRLSRDEGHCLAFDRERML